MDVEQVIHEIEQFRRKQVADADAFANGLRERLATTKEGKRPRQKNNFRYVYVTERYDGSFAIRFQSKYGQRYLRSGYDDHEKAVKDALYLDDSLHVFADAIRRQERGGVQP